jgi:hypothetical protein
MHTMTEAILKQIKGESFEEGARAACEWLGEVYGEGIHETDAWKEYVGAVEGCDCEGCDEEGEGE